ncbi:PEP/pyruvate-binding domain-containing protein [Streptomyces sp. NPDC004609]|uniref:PEP/pyruvate-binding domain-containing protein n=1 Tax=Streptomyces sp. NPDC004609 TaxID=3364704 RepID=UPI00369901A6
MGKYIVHLGADGEAGPSRLGGKGASLAAMAAAGVPVPPGFAVTTDAFDAVLAQGGLRAWVDEAVGGIDLADPAAADRVSASVRRAVEAQPVPAGVDEELRAAYRELTKRTRSGFPVAVRSSATAEDLPEAGFAGQHDSYLWVTGSDAVLDAVRRCWAGLFTTRAIVYRARHRIPAEGLSMAVAVQRMVRSRVAGVALTLDPGNGDRSKIVVDASWGIGELVASGEVTPDNFVVDKVVLAPVRTTLSDKREELVPDPAGGALVRRPVKGARRTRPSLTPDEVVAVARLAKAAEHHYGVPQEVEWAIGTGPSGPAGVVLLQSRPETVWSRRPPTAPSAAPGAGPEAEADADRVPDRDTGPAAGPDSVMRTLLEQPPLTGPVSPGTGDAADGSGPEAGRPAIRRRPGGRAEPPARTRTRFPSPYELTAPPGAEGWQRLYPYYLVFRPELRDADEHKFWFCDTQHWPRVLKPFEVSVVEFAMRCLGQYNSRYFVVPTAAGIEYRVHNGYVYMSPLAVADDEIPARATEFRRRAGHYYAHWEALLKQWKRKVLATIDEIEELDFTALPEQVPFADVESGHGRDAGLALFGAYDRLIRLCQRSWQYHMEFLNLGYSAFLDFYEYCRRRFPGIPDQGIATMVQGVDMELFRPDDELKSLARLALGLGVAGALRGPGDPGQLLAAVAAEPGGERWLTAWQTARRPWFNFTPGNGLYGSDQYWLDHPSIPLGHVADYIGRLEHGEDIDRRVPELLAERDRVTDEYRALLPPEAARRFTAKLALARRVYPYVENHNFYIEHWTMGVFWRKVRELSGVLRDAGFWDGPDDLLYLGREEVRQVLFDYANGWAVGAPAVGRAYWPPEIARRRAVVDALAAARPEPALNAPPRAITEPFTVMLWGITPDRIADWLGPRDGGGLTGMAASPGVAEGVARVITGAERLGSVRADEILVAPVAAPGWGPVFGKIRGVVTDTGGIMSHAAVVCREYSLPAVTGTGTASTRIRNGQRIRLDGSRGTVTILG